MVGGGGAEGSRGKDLKSRAATGLRAFAPGYSPGILHPRRHYQQTPV